MSQNDFASYYKTLPTVRLIDLSNDPPSLVRKAIPLLQEALEQRGEHEHATRLKDFLAATDEFGNRILPSAQPDEFSEAETWEDMQGYLHSKTISTYDVLTGNPTEVFSDSLPFEKIEITGEIEVIQAVRNEYNISAGYKAWFITKVEIGIYRDSSLVILLRKEPPGKFIAFEREVIRGGVELLTLREPNGEKVYVNNNENEITICTQCSITERPVHFLLMSYDDYGKYLSPFSFEQSVIQEIEAQRSSSGVGSSGNSLNARVINLYKNTLMERTSILTKLSFDSGAEGKAKIGKLEPGVEFYITEPTQNKNLPIKIRIADGREGFLLDDTTSFKFIEPMFANAIKVIVLSIVAVVSVGLVMAVADATGYIVVIGVVIMLLTFLVNYLIGVPLYLLARTIGKRL